jgi:hypothetical protein
MNKLATLVRQYIRASAVSRVVAGDAAPRVSMRLDALFGY